MLRKDDKVLKRLRLGLRRIQKGWCRGTAHKKVAGQSRYCLIGSIGVKEDDAVYRSARSYLGHDPINFNDRKETRKHHIIDLLKRAIAQRKAGLTPVGTNW